ncbi:MAG TPA: YaeQ family protein [Kofleriaceae bacterium]|nr:YaeQ family protein [Kofleriaceae bacterium]
MALTATMRRFEIALSDADRGVYEALDLRVAQHPSESERFLVARVVARCLEHGDGIAFSRGGVSSDDEPALSRRDLRGDLTDWIEIGSPTADRLHRAAKTGARVAAYTWKQPEALAASASDVHRADELELFALDPAFLDAVAATLDRNNRWDLSITGGTLYLSIGGQVIEGTCPRIPIP